MASGFDIVTRKYGILLSVFTTKESPPNIPEPAEHSWFQYIMDVPGKCVSWN